MTTQTFIDKRGAWPLAAPDDRRREFVSRGPHVGRTERTYLRRPALLGDAPALPGDTGSCRMSGPTTEKGGCEVLIHRFGTL